MVDDDPGFRDSLRSLLESDGLAVETYADAADFLARFLPERPACLLLDVRMPGMSGPQLQEELHKRGTRVPLIFITAHGDVAMAVAAVRRGALDFIEKPFGDETLLGLVRRALEIDAEVLRMAEQQKDLSARMSSVSARELEVLGRVVDGKLNKVIAEELGIAVKTVEFHRRRIMAKLQAKTTAELINLVVQDRLTRRNA
ncbi:MAG TPA: response regulator [Burkholderiales bacterium]|nr:response regulator [Burkholderiales bacterium]